MVQHPVYFVERVGTCLKWPKQHGHWYGDPTSETGPSVSAWVHQDGSIKGWVDIRLPSVVVIVTWTDEGMIARPMPTWDVGEGVTGEDWTILHRINNITEGEFKRAVARGGSDLRYIMAGTFREAA